MSQHAFPAVTAAQVSVVICCYTEQRWDDTLAAVTSVLEQQPPPAEVVLVVDHNQGLQDRLRRELSGLVSSGRVVITDNVEQRGLAGARNSGVKVAGGDVIAFLDDDAVAAPSWLADLAGSYAPTVLGVGGSANPVWPHGRRPSWFPVEFDWVVGCSYLGLPTEAGPIRNFIGANMSLRREVLDRTGGFSHDLGRVGTHPAGCEETELCIRARRAVPGGELIYVPMAEVHHRVTPDRITWSYFWRRCYAEGISKSVVARLSDPRTALETERRYVTRVLPAGVLRGLRLATRGRLAEARQAAVIVAALGITTAGYLRGRLAR